MGSPFERTSSLSGGQGGRYRYGGDLLVTCRMTPHWVQCTCVILSSFARQASTAQPAALWLFHSWHRTGSDVPLWGLRIENRCAGRWARAEAKSDDHVLTWQFVARVRGVAWGRMRPTRF